MAAVASTTRNCTMMLPMMSTGAERAVRSLASSTSQIAAARHSMRLDEAMHVLSASILDRRMDPLIDPGGHLHAISTCLKARPYVIGRGGTSWAQTDTLSGMPADCSQSDDTCSQRDDTASSFIRTACCSWQ